MDKPEALGQHQHVIVHCEMGIAQLGAHLGAVPELLVSSSPLRHGLITLALVQGPKDGPARGHSRIARQLGMCPD
jgi:hypothetical protein